MARRIFLHIGLHKTGTTSLQHAFAAAGVVDGLHYPQAGCSRIDQAHHNIYREYTSLEAERAQFRPGNLGMAAVREELEATDQDALISSEGLWVLARDEPEAFARLVAELKRCGAVIPLIVWRNAAEYAESLYFQAARTKQMPDLASAISWFGNVPGEFARAIDAVIAATPERVLIVQYGEDMLAIMRAMFAECFGFRPAGAPALPLAANCSLNSMQKIVAAHCARHAVPLPPAAYAALIESFQTVRRGQSPERASMLPEHVQIALIDRSLAKLEYLRSRHISVCFYPPEGPRRPRPRSFLLNRPRFSMFSDLQSALERACVCPE